SADGLDRIDGLPGQVGARGAVCGNPGRVPGQHADDLAQHRRVLPVPFHARRAEPFPPEALVPERARSAALRPLRIPDAAWTMGSRLGAAHPDRGRDRRELDPGLLADALLSLPAGAVSGRAPADRIRMGPARRAGLG